VGRSRGPSSVLRRLAALVILCLCGTALLSEPARADEQSGTSHRSGAWLPATPDQWPLLVDEAQGASQVISHGMQHWVDNLRSVGGAQVAQVLEANLGDPNVRLGVVESHDHLTDPQGEVLTSMAGRTGAVAGINGDFFEIHGSGRPLGMVVIDGRLVKSPNPSWTASLGVRADGSVVIGTEAYSGTVTDGAASRAITSVNTVNDLAPGWPRTSIQATGWLFESRSAPMRACGRQSAVGPSWSRTGRWRSRCRGAVRTTSPTR
jgi:hypothetical protein